METQNNINASKKIAELLSTGKYIIICDTNIFLGLYRDSPDYATFALKCLERVEEHIYLPVTVKVEFARHSKEMYRKHNAAIDRVSDDVIEMINRQKSTLISGWNSIVSKEFPESEKLIEDIEAAYSSIEKRINEYFDAHNELEIIKESWKSDIVEDFVASLIGNGQVLPDLSREELYKICEEGEARYKKNIPPGFKDGKNKDGIRKYSDLIMWKEVLSYAKENQVSVIFVTDDVKADWWTADATTKKFLPDLIREFCKETYPRHKESENPSLDCPQIIPYISKDFYIAVSSSYGIIRNAAIDQALDATLEKYINAIQDSAFEKVEDNLIFSPEAYIDENNSYMAGDMGLEEAEIDDYSLKSYAVIERFEDTAIYELIYNVKMTGCSYDYWGRDDDTKEIILSPAYRHVFEGTVKVEVRRNLGAIAAFADDWVFEEATIVDSSFAETKCTGPFYEEDDLPDGNVLCPECGCRITEENDGGNGFCVNCTK